jgi:hypothetical protein
MKKPQIMGPNGRQRSWFLSWKHFSLTVLVIFCFIEAPRIGDWIVIQQTDSMSQVKLKFIPCFCWYFVPTGILILAVNSTNTQM